MGSEQKVNLWIILINRSNSFCKKWFYELKSNRQINPRSKIMLTNSISQHYAIQDQIS